jgi:hypothetical protein
MTLYRSLKRRLKISIKKLILLKYVYKFRSEKNFMKQFDEESSLHFFYKSDIVFMPDTGGVMSQHYRRGIFYEMGMLEAIRQEAKSGTYLDVGANIGNHTLYFEKFCNSDRVIAFEPLGQALGPLKQTRKFNQLSFEIHETGLSDRSGIVETLIGRRTYSIPVMPLDDLGLDNVSIVKIDIEGMESLALQGMLRTLERCKPILFLEAHDEDEIEEQKKVISTLGYQMSGRVWNATPTYEWKIN